MYSRVKNCIILICFTIVNKVSFFQVAFKLTKNITLFLCTIFLKNKNIT